MIQNINLNGATVSAELHGYMYDNLYGYSGVFDYGSKLAYEIVSNNEIRIKDGLLSNKGRLMRVLGYETISIENGTSGVKRTDLIVAHFETDGINETHDLRVIKGNAGGATHTHTTGDIYNGDTVNELPLYEVHLNGLNVVTVNRVFNIINNVKNIDDRLRENLFKPTQGTIKKNGITATYNDDGTYTINGTATGDGADIHLGYFKGLSGKRVLGCPSGGGDGKYELYVTNTDTWNIERSDYGDGVNISTEISNEKEWAVRIWVESGVTVNNLLFKPMITRDLCATYDDFITFDESVIFNNQALTWEEIATQKLTGKIASAQALREVQNKFRINFLNPTLNTTTINGVTITNNDDGTYTFNGTATSDIFGSFNCKGLIPKGTYKLLGCPKGGSGSTFKMFIYDTSYVDGGSGTVVTFDNDTYLENNHIDFAIYSGYTCNNLVFKPMLTTDLNATNDDFVSFTKSLLTGETINIVKSSLYKPNLLINGDFQCNQRGKSDYNITSAWQYTIDMWKGYNIYLNTANKGVISIVVPETQRGYFVQHLVNFENGTYTVIINVPTINRGKIKYYLEGAGTEQVEITKAGLHLHTFENVNGATKLVLLLDNFYGDIKYIDLFEGDIAYPHVKEDYAIALNRCSQYIQFYNDIRLRMNVTHANGTVAYFDFVLKNAMKLKPTITYNNYIIAKVIGNSTVSSVNIITYISSLDNFTIATDYNTSLNDIYLELFGLLVTCEPL